MIEEEFWKRIDIREEDECWSWKGAKLKRGGYGHLTIKNKTIRAHRLAYKYKKGIIPDGVDVLHHCDNPPCCNPQHLYLGGDAENTKDKWKRNRSNWQIQPRLKGAQHPGATLTDEQICLIRKEYEQGYKQKDIAFRYKITQAYVSKIVRWRSRQP